MAFSEDLPFSFLANLLATVFMLLDLNPTMSVIFNLPAIVASTIVASRVVRRLAMFANDGPEVFASTSHSQGGQRNGFKGMRTGVHVQMETFTHAEDLEPDLQSGGDRLGDNEEKLPRLVPEGHDTDTEDEGKGHHL
ncbi:hypothetical protein H0H81_006658 [Sphagnurus paluster]|uniref:Uncharacterized protein n=1 Tax=Sphagnurus paluster TaxID=117069 RepID=A0A9P7FTL1_9AGAR|nr:hypothetical protein H0H81_006658 [Sphagnurus paluster]